MRASQRSSVRPVALAVVIDAHPRPDSLCASLARRYVIGAQRAGVAVRHLALRELGFDPHVRTHRPQDQPLEPDLQAALALLESADHLVFVYPTWWGAMPALLKGFLDRVMLPGRSFRERDGHEGYEPLWRGKTADLVTTMDTPPLVHRFVFGRPGIQALGKATLSFCGVRIARIRAFGPVNASQPAQRLEWHERVQTDAERLSRAGALHAGQRALDRVAAWLAAMRLQFHPVPWTCYLLGALAACSGRWQDVGGAAFWVGLAWLFTLETLTVFTNDWFDRDSDRRNTHHGPFNGGARVLVDGRLSDSAFRRGMTGCAIAFGLLTMAGATLFEPDVLYIALPLAVLAIGYTVPPLQLAWRGLGELTVIVTNGLGTVLLGWIALGGDPFAADAWLLGTPIALSILPAITLATLPDRDADAAAGKRTLAVRFGAPTSLRIAQVGSLGAVVAAGLGWQRLPFVESGPWATALLVGMIVHAGVLLARCQRLRDDAGTARRSDGSLVLALAYILWFVAWPFVAM